MAQCSHKKAACAQQMPFQMIKPCLLNVVNGGSKKRKWGDKISLSSLVCIRQGLLTLSICQLYGSDFPLPKMHMCISRVVSCGCVHVKKKKKKILYSSLSLYDH